MDASFGDWGAILDGHPAHNLWQGLHLIQHSIAWKMRAIAMESLGIDRPFLRDYHVFFLLAPVHVGAAVPALDQEQTDLTWGSLYSRAFKYMSRHPVKALAEAQDRSASESSGEGPSG